LVSEEQLRNNWARIRKGKKEMYTSNFPIPAVAADIILLRWNQNRWEILLIRRGENPFKGKEALPGGHGEPGESLEETADRELEEEAHPRRNGQPVDIRLEQFRTFSKPGRDPRGWYVTTVFWGIVPEDVEVTADSDADKADWFPLNDDLPPLAFDHLEIIELFKLCDFGARTKGKHSMRD
jgi:8-oxo-dGTP diphosphatase